MLKLKLNTSGIKVEESASTPTPSSGKIKLKLGAPKAEKAGEKATAAPKKSIIKAPNPNKEKLPKLKLGKKRNHAEFQDSIADGSDTPTSAKIQKLKLTAKNKKTPVTPSSIKLNFKGRPPLRPKGQGYDSEASDAERDPHIEENFILRMVPGEDCDYVRQAIQDKNWGKEGAKVRLKFLQNDGRRAVLTVRGRMYAAIFVDMPCIVEGVKSWDKKAWYKVADICQMLMVLGLVQSENEASTYPIPEREVDNRTWAYAHGLTPPMHWVRKRRFRKRISTHTIEEVEAQVQRLLAADDAAQGGVRYEVIDPNKARAQNAREEGEQSDVDDDMDGEGEADEGEAVFEAEAFPNAEDEDGNVDDLEAQFESFMAQDEAEGGMEVEEAETPASSAAVMEVQQMESSEAETPAATSKEETEEEESEEEDDEDDVDEDEMEQRVDIQRQREEIADLENAIKDQLAEMDRVQSGMLKNKIQNKIQSLKADLELKKSAIGEGEED